MSEADSADDSFDLIEAVREDPPRVRDPDQLDVVAQLRLGNAMYVYETEERGDGRYIGHLGVTKPRDTSEAALGREITFLNYSPVGALIATPTGDGEYTVRLPDRDAIQTAIRARERTENDHRAAVLPPLRNLLDATIDKHRTKSEESSEEYRAGVHAGMALMSDFVLRELWRRWNAPYRGTRRWQDSEPDGRRRSS